MSLSKSTMKGHEDQLFHGRLADEYSLLSRVCPELLDCSREVAALVAAFPQRTDGRPLEALELGCGTGLSTLRFLQSREDLILHAIDLAEPMLIQAREALAEAHQQGRVSFECGDMVRLLEARPSESADLVLSNYALHNLLEAERKTLIREIARVLRPGGALVNGDRYGMDESDAHLARLQQEIRVYFREFLAMNRPDLLEAWILHVFSDESPDRVMRLQPSLALLLDAGFETPVIHYREGINAVLLARRPLS